MDIRALAVAATRSPGAHIDAAEPLLPALNRMIDITTTRTMAARIHPPLIVFALLFLPALVCSVPAGYEMAGSKQRRWLRMTAFAAVAVISVYVALEIEYPRVGLIRINAYDQVPIDAREKMQ